MKQSDFQIEESTLQNVVSWVEKEKISKNPRNIPFDEIWATFGGADIYTAQALQAREVSKWENWKKVVDSPYFGRLDLSIEKSAHETYYIGRSGFKNEYVNVLDWRSPISSIYYQKINEESYQQRYISPQGPMIAKLLLKRHLEINHRKLETIQDEVDRRHDDFQPPDKKVGTNVLIQSLERRGDPKLQDIVKSIQPDQDDLIRTQLDQVLIINGVAGSGKTSIGFHRLAYLLFPESNTRLLPSEVLIFGPNRLFLSYVKNLLPSLNVESVKQVTFDDWALERIGLIRTSKRGEKVRDIKIQESALMYFIDRKSSIPARRRAWRRSRIKGSLKFGEVLERLVEQEKKNLLTQVKTIHLTDIGEIGLSITLSEDEIRQTLQTKHFRSQPLFEVIASYTSSLLDLIPQKYLESLKVLQSSKVNFGMVLARERVFPGTRQKNLLQAKNKLKDKLDQLWRIESITSLYSGLLADKARLASVCNGLFDPKEIDLLGSNHIEKGVVDLEDIAALCYLHILLYGKGHDRYKHLMIDEGQDFSPLHYKIFELINPYRSMTILGDLSQGILAHRGISAWRELDSVFYGKIKLANVSQSYRSTYENTQLNNEILLSLQQKNPLLATPLPRHGAVPNLTISKSPNKMIKLVTEDIQMLLNRGVKNIGVIFKAPDEIEYFSKLIAFGGTFEVSTISNRDEMFDYSGGVVLLPVALSKGLEFEAVLVIDVSEENYNSQIAYDGRLFYVATTRALHHLRLFSVGTPTGYLNSSIRKSILKIVEA